MQRKLFPFIFIFLISFFLAACSFQSVEEYENQEEQEKSITAQTDIKVTEKVEIGGEAQKESENHEKIKANESNVKTTTESVLKPDNEITQETADPVDKKKEAPTSAKKDEPVIDKKVATSEKSFNSPTSGVRTEKPTVNKEESSQNTTETVPSKAEGKKRYATIAIRVDTLLENWDLLDPALQSEKYVPRNGVILKTTKYELISEKETVWDVLVRATKEHKIQMEYQGANENAYKSVYVEGINYLYEFSAGELSGWMYKVNNNYPNYGSSQYVLKDGDVIEWHYTIDLGRDLGEVWVGE